MHWLDPEISDRALAVGRLLLKINGMDLKIQRSLQRWEARDHFYHVGKPLEIQGNTYVVAEKIQLTAGAKNRVYALLDLALRDGSFRD